MRLRLLIVVAVAVAFANPAWAQEQPDWQDATSRLSAVARARVIPSDTTLSFRTHPVVAGRMDTDAGVLRAAYRIQTQVGPSDSPEVAARAYLRQVAPQFGWPGDTHDLVLHSVRPGTYNSHIVFQQVLDGVPVYNRFVAVSLDAARQPTMALSTYAPRLLSVRGFSTLPAVPKHAARDSGARAVSSGAVRTTDPELMVYPSQPPRLAWRLIVWPQDVAAEWEVLIDAHTGELIQLINQVTHIGREGERERGREGRSGDAGFAREVNLLSGSIGENVFVAEQSRFTSTSPSRSRFRFRPQVATDGSGLVFDPDPVTSAGVAYGETYVDDDDADASQLTAQLRPVVLRDLSFRDGRYYLEGPYVAITGDASVGGSAYEPPSEADPNAFTYSRSDDRFEAVMAYYHIDQSQRYVQSLDIGRPIHSTPILVNPHGFGNQDNSQFFPWLDAIAFGEGGVDDAEDAQVIWHEYAHALLEASAPGHITLGGEGIALHEGWADYWAASYVRGRMEESEIPEGDWRRLFRWDGNNPPWCGRTLDHNGHYPDAVSHPAPPGCSVSPEYQRGVLWATTLMEVYTALGRTVTDRLNLASHGYLGVPSVTFRDAAEAILQADADLYEGVHAGVLTAIFESRGFLGPVNVPPQIVHVPVAPVDEGTRSVEIQVTVAASSPPVDSVFVYYLTEGVSFQRMLLSASDQGFNGALGLPLYPVDVEYYVEAVASSGRRASLPANAPAEVYSFRVGPDELVLYPNFPEPFSDATKVMFRLPQPEHVVLELYDLLGRRILVLEEGEREAGTFSLWLDGHSLAAGTYILRMRAGDVQHSELITVVR